MIDIYNLFVILKRDSKKKFTRNTGDHHNSIN